jgi:23S rRNA pseudouridine2605 synthase
MEQRLQKLLASAGIGSRRSCEALITAGKVTVNGAVVKELGTKADPERDDIRVKGRPVEFGGERVYILLNKPTGYVTTVSDPHAKHTVMDLVREVPGRIYPVGRLDQDSAGLLILTNDGEFTERMTHPSHQVTKSYRAVVRGEVPSWAAADLRQGILLEDGMTAPAQVEWVDFDENHNTSIIDITIHEGRNRQVRRMFEAVGFPVLALTRMSIGPLQLKGIAPGTWRRLHPAEVKALLDAADSTPASLPKAHGDTEADSEPPATVRSPRKYDAPKAPPRPMKHIVDPEARKRAEAIRDEARKLSDALRAAGPDDDDEDTGPRPAKQDARTPQPRPAQPRTARPVQRRRPPAGG